MLRRAFLAALLALALASPALAGAGGYVVGDPNVPVFGPSNLGSFPPGPETPTNHSMVSAPPIAQPAQQTGVAAMTQTITGSMTASSQTLTLSSPASGGTLPVGTQIIAAGMTFNATLIGTLSTTGGTGTLVVSGLGNRPTAYLNVGATLTGGGITGTVTITATVGSGDGTYTVSSTNNLSITNGAFTASTQPCTAGGQNNCPIILSGSGTSYTVSFASTTSIGPVTMQTQPLGLNEIAVAAWDTVQYQHFDSGFAFGCLADKGIQGDGPVDFYLDGSTTPIRATTETANSTTGAPDFCWAAPVSLFAGKNGMHQVSAVASTPAGFPVVLQSTQLVTEPASGNVFTVLGWTPIHQGTIGAQAANKLVYITGSTDSAFPNASASNPANQQLTYAGLYCVFPSDGNTFQLALASYIKQPANKNGTPGCGAVITPTAPGATFNMTPFHAGGSFEKATNQFTGSLFFFVNPPGTANSVPEPVAYASNAGSDTTGDGTAGNPSQTLTGALLAITPANVETYAIGVGTQPAQSVGPVGSPVCTGFTLSGNVTGSPGLVQNEPVKYDGVGGGGGGVFMMDAIYFVNLFSGDTVTLSGVPGGPCIDDPHLDAINGATSCATGSTTGCASFYADYSFTTLLMQHSGGSGPNSFALGTGASRDRYTRLGHLLVTFDPVTANFDNVQITSEGATGGFSTSTGPGLSAESLEVTAKGIIPTATLHLTRDIAKGSLITSVNVSAAEFAPFASMFIAGATSSGSQTTLLLDGGNCLPASGSAGDGNAVSSVTVTGISTVGGTTTIALAANVPVFAAFHECPVGMPVTFSTAWNYDAGGAGYTANENLWLNGSVLVANSPNAANGSAGWIGQEFITNSSLINLLTGSTLGAGNVYLANSTISGAGSKATQGDRVMSNSIIDRSGPEAFDYMVNQIGAGPAGFGSVGSDAYGIAADPIIDTSVVNASISGNTLIINSVTSGQPKNGMGLGVLQWITPQAEVGNVFTLNFSQFVYTLTGASGASQVTISSAVTGNAAFVGMTIVGQGAGGAGIQAGTTITSFASGTGGNGSVANISLPLTAALSGAQNAWGIGPASSRTLTRSIWKLGPPGNTTIGNTVPVPSINLGFTGSWQYTGSFVAIANTFEVTSFDRDNSTVVLAGAPPATCISANTCTLASGSVLLSVDSGAHFDMNALDPLQGQFSSGEMVQGLQVINSDGFSGGTYLSQPALGQNTFFNANNQIYPSLFNVLATYADIAHDETQRNAIYRGGTAYIIKTNILWSVNGTFIFDGWNCPNNAGILTGESAASPGFTVRNTGWPGQGGLPAGNC